MVYSELIFLLVLFPITAIVTTFDRSTEYKNLILILSSVVFFSWGRPFAFCLIFLSVFADWLLGLAVSKNNGSRALAGLFLLIDALMNTGIFLVFRHNYLFDKADRLSFDTAILPLGIAFYSLRGFSYVYDVFKGHIRAEKNPLCLLTYMVSFHLMLVGPLVRYGEIEPQIRKREITTDKLNTGLNKIFLGLGKVVLLAGVFERIKLAGLNGAEITTLGCWLGMISFLGQYYFLFTGFSDMAKGLGLVGGFVYPDNYHDIDPDGLFTGLVKSFNTTVTEFFAELLGLDKEHSKGFTFMAAILCGGLLSLWYEARLNFLIVGLAAGVLIAFEKLVLAKPLSKFPAAVKYIYMALVSMVIFGGLYFESTYGYKKWLFALLGVNTKYTLSVSVKYAVLKNITLIFIAIIIFLPFLKNAVIKLTDSIAAKGGKYYGFIRILKTVCTAFVFALSVITLVVEYSGV